MKKIILFSLILIATLAISGCSILSSPKQDADLIDSSQSAEIAQTVQFIISTAEGELVNQESNFQPDLSVYELLKNITQQANLDLQIKEYDFGILVEAINHKTNGDQDKYWLFYINDEMPMVSVDNYQLKAGDKVEFKFEESTF